MTRDPQKLFEARIERLREERAYILPGWHVRVRTVRTESRPWRLSLKEWLMYPVFVSQAPH